MGRAPKGPRRGEDAEGDEYRSRKTPAKGDPGKRRLRQLHADAEASKSLVTGTNRTSNAPQAIRVCLTEKHVQVFACHEDPGHQNRWSPAPTGLICLGMPIETSITGRRFGGSIFRQSRRFWLEAYGQPSAAIGSLLKFQQKMLQNIRKSKDDFTHL